MPPPALDSRRTAGAWLGEGRRRRPVGGGRRGGKLDVHTGDSRGQVSLITHLAAGDAKVDRAPPKETD